MTDSLHCLLVEQEVSKADYAYRTLELGAQLHEYRDKINQAKYSISSSATYELPDRYHIVRLYLSELHIHRTSSGYNEIASSH